MGFRALLQLANFTLGPDATFNTEIHKNSVRIKAPNSVNASKRKYKNQINHYKLPPLKLPGQKRPQVLLPKRPHKYELFMVKNTKFAELHYFTNMIVYYGILTCLTIFKDIFIQKIYFSI